MKTFILCIAALVCSCSTLYGQVDTTCLKWLCDYGIWSRWEECINPDSVYVDTCAASIDEPGKAWDYLYAKSPFRVRFYKTDILPLAPVPKDSVVEVTWGSISVSYPAIRARFAEIEQQFGSFFLRREYPDEPISTFLSGYFLVRFVQRIHVRDVEKLVNDRTEQTDIRYIGKTGIPVSSVETEKNTFSTEKLTLAPNPSTSELSATLYGYGKQHLEITDMMGNSVLSVPIECYAAPCVATFSIAHLPVGVYTVSCGTLRQLLVVVR